MKREIDEIAGQSYFTSQRREKEIVSEEREHLDLVVAGK